MTGQLTTIEIKGVKLDVDLREAKQVNVLKVGDRCKILVKSDYGGDKVHRGVVIGFEPFETRPTIIICYLHHEYSACELKFAYINAKSNDYELVKSLDDDGAGLDKEEMLRYFEREVAKKEGEIADLDEKRNYFLRKFQAYWEPVATRDPAEEQPAQ